MSARALGAFSRKDSKQQRCKTTERNHPWWYTTTVLTSFFSNAVVQELSNCQSRNLEDSGLVLPHLTRELKQQKPESPQLQAALQRINLLLPMNLETCRDPLRQLVVIYNMMEKFNRNLMSYRSYTEEDAPDLLYDLYWHQQYEQRKRQILALKAPESNAEKSPDATMGPIATKFIEAVLGCLRAYHADPLIDRSMFGPACQASDINTDTYLLSRMWLETHLLSTDENALERLQQLIKLRWTDAIEEQLEDFVPFETLVRQAAPWVNKRLVWSSLDQCSTTQMKVATLCRLLALFTPHPETPTTRSSISIMSEKTQKIVRRFFTAAAKYGHIAEAIETASRVFTYTENLTDIPAGSYIDFPEELNEEQLLDMMANLKLNHAYWLQCKEVLKILQRRDADAFTTSFKVLLHNVMLLLDAYEALPGQPRHCEVDNTPRGQDIRLLTNILHFSAAEDNIAERLMKLLHARHHPDRIAACCGNTSLEELWSQAGETLRESFIKTVKTGPGWRGPMLFRQGQPTDKNPRDVIIDHFKILLEKELKSTKSESETSVLRAMLAIVTAHQRLPKHVENLGTLVIHYQQYPYRRLVTPPDQLETLLSEISRVYKFWKASRDVLRKESKPEQLLYEDLAVASHRMIAFYKNCPDDVLPEEELQMHMKIKALCELRNDPDVDLGDIHQELFDTMRQERGRSHTGAIITLRAALTKDLFDAKITREKRRERVKEVYKILQPNSKKRWTENESNIILSILVLTHEHDSSATTPLTYAAVECLIKHLEKHPDVKLVSHHHDWQAVAAEALCRQHFWDVIHAAKTTPHTGLFASLMLAIEAVLDLYDAGTQDSHREELLAMQETLAGYEDQLVAIHAAMKMVE